MHLYGAFESLQFSKEADPLIFAAAKVALLNRIKASREDATHGYMHMSLAAVGLGLGDIGFGRLEMLAKRRSIFLNMVDGHFGGPELLCDDGNGATPEIVNRMLVQSSIGRLALLPALPTALKKGSVQGMRARGQIGIKEIAWDMAKGNCTTTFISEIDQSVKLVMPENMKLRSITGNRQAMPISLQGVNQYGTLLILKKGKPLVVDIAFESIK